MIQNVLRGWGDISTYGVVSLCLFCLVFVGVMAWALTRPRVHLDRMAQLPLENEPESSNPGDPRDESRL